MDLGLSGRRAAVAASTAGLGLAVAEALADEGCSVVISGRDPERLGRAAERVPGAIPVVADVSGAAGATEFVHDATRLRSVWGEKLPAVTQKVPARRLGDPADFGRVAALLCSEWAGYVTGAAVPVDGGLSQGLQ